MVVLLCIFSIVFGSSVRVGSYERDKHDRLMLDVLFKNFKDESDVTNRDEIKALENACYLTIDQFNNSGQKALDELHMYGVKGIPKKIADINISDSPSKHRSHTHRGWDYQYFADKAELWSERKEILIKTVGTIFDFEGDIKKQENFCKLLYYIHILGDHMDDTSYKINNGLKIDVGGRVDKNDIIHEWQKCIEVVFAEQKHTHKYRSLTTELEKYNSRFSKIVRSAGGINSDEKFALHKKYSENLMKLMTMYIPEMLKEEGFFYNVFYK